MDDQSLSYWPQRLEEQQVSHRNHAHELVPVQDWQMANAQIEHAGHDIIRVLSIMRDRQVLISVPAVPKLRGHPALLDASQLT